MPYWNSSRLSHQVFLRGVFSVESTHGSHAARLHVGKAHCFLLFCIAEVWQIQACWCVECQALTFSWAPPDLLHVRNFFKKYVSSGSYVIRVSSQLDFLVRVHLQNAALLCVTILLPNELLSGGLVSLGHPHLHQSSYQCKHQFFYSIILH